jgi:ribosome biogenesis ATPase
LDGLEPRKQVFVIGATNRPDILDPAMVRPGRLDKLLYVGLPTPEERVDILRAQTKHTPINPEVNLEQVALDPRCDGFSGADLSALVREAAVSSLREIFSKVEIAEVEDGNEWDTTGASTVVPVDVIVEMRHFTAALTKTSPSVSVQQRRRFAILREKFAGQPVGHAKESGSEEDIKVQPVKDLA